MNRETKLPFDNLSGLYSYYDPLAFMPYETCNEPQELDFSLNNYVAENAEPITCSTTPDLSMDQTVHLKESDQENVR